MFDDAAELEPVVVVVLLTSMKFDMETDSPPMMKDTVPSSSSFTPSTTPERVSLSLLLLYFIDLPMNVDAKDIWFNCNSVTKSVKKFCILISELKLEVLDVIMFYLLK